MTLILSLVNERQAIQLSDRRLTYTDGRDPDEESDKAIVVVTADARLAMGYTGLAAARRYTSHTWLQETLLDVAPPDHAAGAMLERLCGRLTTRFAQADLRRLDGTTRRLTVMFSGYLYNEEPPRAAYALVTNFQDFGTGRDAGAAWPMFKIHYAREIRPHAEPVMTMVQRIGAWSFVPGKDLNELRAMLAADKPSRAIIGKALEVFRDASERSGGAVGKQISSVVIPRSADQQTEGGYHSDVVRYEIELPAMVVALPEARFAARNISFGVSDPESGAPPIAGPKIPRNQPCWCGSGKKFKRCHGA